MFPNIKDVNQAIFNLKNDLMAAIKPFHLTCKEMGLILQNIPTPQHREIVIQLFRPYLTDTSFDDAVLGIDFIVEKNNILNALSKHLSVQKSYICDIPEHSSSCDK
ncbi:hypothetical protein SS50377_28276 [Spironucleus salmonicida]|uniref:Uncharacterized protein n=1 Tax=Spironucleus salmonicida TaxID=348837 RepID=V6LV45_9EUKA|nr:hypothetical protein SS50377_28276 [Spironucleus salmonicida]|eukprot:EST48455.1 Hypothetical protein SS50377_11404 [Spironucleus salmonicida]